MNNVVTYDDILKMIENPAKLFGHLILEHVNTDNLCPTDPCTKVQILIDGVEILKPHDMNDVMTNWIKDWVMLYLEDNYNFTDFQKKVADQVDATIKEKYEGFLNDLSNTKDKFETQMETVFNSFADVTPKDLDYYKKETRTLREKIFSMSKEHNELQEENHNNKNIIANLKKELDCRRAEVLDLKLQLGSVTYPSDKRS